MIVTAATSNPETCSHQPPDSTRLLLHLHWKLETFTSGWGVVTQVTVTTLSLSLTNMNSTNLF